MFEGLGGMSRPERVVERLAPNCDQISAVLLQDLLGVLGLDDEPDRHCGDAGLVPDALGVWHLVAGGERLSGGRRRARRHPAGGAVDDIDAAVAQRRGERHGVLKLPPHGVRRRDPEEERQVLRPSGPHRFGELEGKPHAVAERAAVPVAPLIGLR